MIDIKFFKEKHIRGVVDGDNLIDSEMKLHQKLCTKKRAMIDRRKMVDTEWSKASKNINKKPQRFYEISYRQQEFPPSTELQDWVIESFQFKRDNS